MSRDDLLGLIFLPGFSTSDQITDLSGRGVGMDVVKTNISKLGGGKRINKVEDVANVGDKMQVEITDIDARGKISLVPVAEGSADGAAAGAPAAAAPAAE